MTARHSFTMDDEYQDQRNDTPHSTRIEMNFETDQLDDVVDEFLNYLLHCGFTYVERIEVHKTAYSSRDISDPA